MKIETSSRFVKMYKKLSLIQQEIVDNAILRFREDPFQPSLRNHALKGKLAGLRSIKAGYDLRLVYEEKNGYVVVVFLELGSHDQVY